MNRSFLSVFRRPVAWLMSTAVLVSVALHASPAQAQMVHVPSSDWRQSDRHDIILAAEKPQRFLLELRFGPYLPAIDNEFAGGTGPFQRVFGMNCGTSPPTQGSVSPAFYFGLEADYLPVRIPYVGGLGVGFGWGYTTFSNGLLFAGADLTDPNTKCSKDTSTLTIMPMYGALVLRFDELMRKTGIPIVPYGKVGAGLGWWRASSASGTETCSKDSVGGCSGMVNGTGLSPSLHFAIGGSLALNFLEPRSSARLSESSGVGHAYLFGEWWNETTPLSTKVMIVGTSAFAGGLAVDF